VRKERALRLALGSGRGSVLRQMLMTALLVSLAAFDKYLDVVNAAIMRHGPNHLNLGLRLGGSASGDAASVEGFRRIQHERLLDVGKPEGDGGDVPVTGRPIIVGEFHFGVPGRGLAAGRVQVRDQAERGVAYRYYVEQAATFPAFIGSS
jgi:hypothetical protein